MKVPLRRRSIKSFELLLHHQFLNSSSLTVGFQKLLVMNKRSLYLYLSHCIVPGWIRPVLLEWIRSVHISRRILDTDLITPRILFCILLCASHGLRANMNCLKSLMHIIWIIGFGGQSMNITYTHTQYGIGNPETILSYRITFALA